MHDKEKEQYMFAVQYSPADLNPWDWSYKNY